MDALHSIIFYILAAIVLASAAFTAFSSNLVHAAFSLLFTFFGLACLYIQLGADFVGVSQVVVYVGGILVLLLFGVMFTGSIAGGITRQTIQTKWSAFILVVLLAVLLPIVYVTPWGVMDSPQNKELTSNVEVIGKLLLTDYLLPFEIASLLLLIALVGAVVIARGEPKAPEPSEDENETAVV